MGQVELGWVGLGEQGWVAVLLEWVGVLWSRGQCMGLLPSHTMGLLQNRAAPR